MVNKIFTRIFIGFIRIYQLGVAPFFPPTCRHQPTCSYYAVEALRLYGVGRGMKLSFKRILQCRPGGSFGYDPVPKKNLAVDIR